MSKKGKVSRDEVLKIAALAKLNLTEAEVEKYTAQMNQILSYVEQLNKIDTENVEPLSHVLELTNVSGEDVEEPSLSLQDALRNAPESDGEYFVVPTVIEKSS